MKMVIVAIACSLGVLNIWVALLEVAKKKSIKFQLKKLALLLKFFNQKKVQ